MVIAASPLPPLIAPGAQIGYQWSRTEDNFCLGIDQPRKDHTGQGLGDGLRHGAGNGDRTRRPHLAEGIGMHRDAEARRFGQHLAGVSVETHRRHRWIDIQRQEGALQKGFARTGDGETDVGDVGDVRRQRGRGEYVLAGAGKAGVGRVDVEAVQVGHVARHQRTAEEMQVLKAVDHARGSVEIGQVRLSVATRLEVQDHRCRAAGADVHASATELHVVLRSLTTKRKVLNHPLQRALDQLS